MGAVFVGLLYCELSFSAIFFSKFLRTVLSVPIIIGISVTFLFHRFFNSLARFKYLHIFHFHMRVNWMQRGQQNLPSNKIFFNTNFLAAIDCWLVVNLVGYLKPNPVYTRIY